MPEIRLEIDYSSNDYTGGCVQCRAEQELYKCLRDMLQEEGSNAELAKKYELLIAFLQSPKLRKMRFESEKYLSEGKKVVLVLTAPRGKPEYKLEVS